MDMALAASRARSVEGGELAIAALENAKFVAVSSCDRDVEAVVSFIERRLEKVLQTRADLTSRLTALAWAPACGDASRARVSQTIKSKTYAYTSSDSVLLSRDLRRVDDDFWSAVANSAVVVADADTLKVAEVCELHGEPQQWQSWLTDGSRPNVTCVKARDDIVCVQSPGSAEPALMMTFTTSPRFRLTAVIEGKAMTSGNVNQLGNAIRSTRANSRCKSP
jgi:hypothetical protein